MTDPSADTRSVSTSTESSEEPDDGRATVHVMLRPVSCGSDADRVTQSRRSNECDLVCAASADAVGPTTVPSTTHGTGAWSEEPPETFVVEKPTPSTTSTSAPTDTTVDRPADGSRRNRANHGCAP